MRVHRVKDRNRVPELPYKFLRIGMTTLERVRAKVIEAVPEILHTKPGCVIQHLEYPDDDDRNYVIVAECGLCSRHKTLRGCEKSDGECDIDDGRYAVSPGGEYDDFGYMPADVKTEDLDGVKWRIIGRPIRLADVLVAMQGKDKPVQSVGVEINGRFLDCNEDMTEWHILEPRWNLRADSLDEQSPETIEFLANVLGV